MAVSRDSGIAMQHGKDASLVSICEADGRVHTMIFSQPRVIHSGHPGTRRGTYAKLAHRLSGEALRAAEVLREL